MARPLAGWFSHKPLEGSSLRLQTPRPAPEVALPLALPRTRRLTCGMGTTVPTCLFLLANGRSETRPTKQKAGWKLLRDPRREPTMHPSRSLLLITQGDVAGVG